MGNGSVTALQFWMADLDPQTLSIATEWIYIAFFCNNSVQQLWTISEEVSFSHFMITLNDAFEQELALEDRGCKSGSKSLYIPTPLHRAPCLYHISASENLSFTPATPLTHQSYSPQCPSNLNTMYHHLMFDDDTNSSIDNNPLRGRTVQSSPTEHQMACHLTNAEEEAVGEHFPLPIWFRSATPHSRIHTSTTIHGPQ